MPRSEMKRPRFSRLALIPIQSPGINMTAGASRLRHAVDQKVLANATIAELSCAITIDGLPAAFEARMRAASRLTSRAVLANAIVKRISAALLSTDQGLEMERVAAA